MLKTNLETLASEINEVINEFEGASEHQIELNMLAEDFSRFSVSMDGNAETFDYRPIAADIDELERKRLLKRRAKLCAYDYLSKVYGKQLPWGALTGIRPTKLVYQQGENYKNFIRDEMRVSQKKFELLERIVQAQSPYYEKNDENVAFYVGIPFCPTRCQYCSFISCEIGKSSAVNEYIGALLKEIEQSFKLVKKLRSVYIGGGTPVSLKLGDLERLLDKIGDVKAEYTVEAGRPDCIDADKLALLKEHGVQRVCVNPQTFSDSTLKLMGRNHTAAETIEKYEMAKHFGFAVNMDLIAGLPLETFDVFKDTLEKTISLDPENITVHTLCLKKGSKLKELCERLPDGEVERMVDYAHERLYKAGYEPYYLYRQKYMAGNLENTGYSKKGKECVYNIDVMEETAQNIACGANAVSKRVYGARNRIERIGAPKDIKTYIDKVDVLIGQKKKLFGDL